MVFPFPNEPDVPADQIATGPLSTRYGEVSQDGRVHLSALPQAFGEIIWLRSLGGHPINAAMRADGIVPVVTRLHIEGAEGTIAAGGYLAGRGIFQLAHSAGEQGAPERLLLHFWASLTGRRGRSHGEAPLGAGEPVAVGRVYGEHVLTRPFAPPANRRVSRLAIEGFQAAYETRLPWHQPAFPELPEGAEPLENGFRTDAAPIAFGLSQTDSTQHVNSLVYPGLFEQATLRRLAEIGKPTHLLARSIELGYRKPCFAGDVVRISLQTFALGGGFGAIAALAPDGAAPGTSATTYARLFLAP